MCYFITDMCGKSFRYGRKTASAFAIPVSIVGGLVASFSTNFVMFNIFRFVTSLGIGGLQNISYTFGKWFLSESVDAVSSARNMV